MDLLLAMKMVVETFTSIGYTVYTEFNREMDFQEYSFYRTSQTGEKRLHFKVQINSETIMRSRAGIDSDAPVKWIIAEITILTTSIGRHSHRARATKEEPLSKAQFIRNYQDFIYHFGV